MKVESEQFLLIFLSYTLECKWIQFSLFTIVILIIFASVCSNVFKEEVNEQGDRTATIMASRTVTTNIHSYFIDVELFCYEIQLKCSPKGWVPIIKWQTSKKPSNTVFRGASDNYKRNINVNDWKILSISIKTPASRQRPVRKSDTSRYYELTFYFIFI